MPHQYDSLLTVRRVPRGRGRVLGRSPDARPSSA